MAYCARCIRRMGIQILDSPACRSLTNHGGNQCCPACLGALDAERHGSAVRLGLKRPYVVQPAIALRITVPPPVVARSVIADARRSMKALTHIGEWCDDGRAPIALKQALKEVWAPVVERELGVPVKDANNIEAHDIGVIYVDLQFKVDSEATARDQLALLPDHQAIDAMKTGRRQQNRRKAVFSVATIHSMSCRMSAEEICKWGASLPECAVPCTLEVEITRSNILVSGRYTKHSRSVSHTPWTIRGERKTKDSVQELIETHMIERWGATASNFTSAGREDVDVRMLGGGRDFVISLTNCLRVPSDDEYPEMEALINASSPLVQVNCLRRGTRDDQQALLDGERTKRKSYRALVKLSRHFSPEMLAAFQDKWANGFTVQQRTPLRVLHRRALMCRPKRIYAWSLRWLDVDSLELELTTEAGTYIKEFVHGDRGRTNPSLSSLLDCDADITQLDVTGLIHDSPCEA